MNINFKEEQKIRQWWLWLILIAIGLFPIIGIYKQLILGEKFGEHPMSNLGLIFFSLFIFAFLVFFWIIQLKTTIDNDKIKMEFFPFVKKSVKWEEIKKVEIVSYGFVGGWGIRLGTKYGTVYNIKGNKGMAIELHNGKKFLIGTQKESELKELLKKVRRQHSEHYSTNDF